MSRAKRSYAEYKASQLATPAELTYSPNVETGEDTDFTSYHSSDSDREVVELHDALQNELDDSSSFSGYDTEGVPVPSVFNEIPDGEPRGFYLDEYEEDIVYKGEEEGEEEDGYEEEEEEDEEEEEEDEVADEDFQYMPQFYGSWLQATGPESPLLKGKLGKQIKATAKMLNFIDTVKSLGVDSDDVDQIRESMPGWQAASGKTPEMMASEHVGEVVRYCMNMKGSPILQLVPEN